jgi:hypothetical protein
MIYGALKLRLLISPCPETTLLSTGGDELPDELLTSWRNGGWNCHSGLNLFLSAPVLPGKTEKPFNKWFTC